MLKSSPARAHELDDRLDDRMMLTVASSPAPCCFFRCTCLQRQRYGYQYEQDTRARNQKALEAMWQARDKKVSDFTPAPVTSTKPPQ